MITFNAKRFFLMTTVLAMNNALSSVRGPEVTEAHKERMFTLLNKALSDCKDIGLEFSATYIGRIIKYLQKDFSHEDVSKYLDALTERIEDEISNNYFLQVPSNRAEYYTKTDLLGAEVQAKFPSAIFDVEEAGKCFAAARFTACVFHLMRVTEIGVMAVARGLGIHNQIKTAQPSWGEVLRLTNQEIQAQNKGNDPSWTADKRGFFENVQADLMTVKNAWRNTTMHVENVYDEERAEDIFNAVKAYMRHLAKHLDESGQFTP